MTRATAALALALAVALAAPGLAEPGLYERNLATLLATLPPDAVLEVRVTGPDGAPATEAWTAARYADFRAERATRMGRDYAAGPEGLPGGHGEHVFLGDIWSDLWGTTRVNVATGFPCLERTMALSLKTWLYRGPCFVAEHENACLPTGRFVICSSSHGWTFAQHSVEHEDAWLGGWGEMVVFPPPFGAVAIFDGAVLAEDLEDGA